MARPETLTAGALPRLDLALGDLADRYDLILCDVWGVIHNGVRHHPQAVDALQRFRKRGGSVVLITNAPAPAYKVIARMDGLGVPRDAYDDVATSGDVTIGMIVEAGCPPLLNIGPSYELDLYRDATERGPRPVNLVGVEQAELVIAISPSEQIGSNPEDYDDLLRKLRDRGLTMICANPDIVVEVGDRLVYCAGAIAERYEAIGGNVIQAGKPFAPIYERALALAWNKMSAVPKSRILAIGDAMHTDMRGAQMQGIDALFITSGIHREALHGTASEHGLDEAVLHQFLDGRDETRPIAALPGLRWAL